MYLIVRLGYVLLGFWCVPVVFFSLPDILQAKGAPQQAAGAAIALAATVIPYIFLRSFEKIADWRIETLGAKTNELLQRIADKMSP